MSLELKTLLVIGAFLAFLYTLKSIRKSQIKIADTVFWLLLSLITFVISIFPSIVYALTGILHIQSPTNLVFLMYIGFLLYKVFAQSITISKLNTKLEIIAQKMAIEDHEYCERFNKMSDRLRDTSDAKK